MVILNLKYRGGVLIKKSTVIFFILFITVLTMVGCKSKKSSFNEDEMKDFAQLQVDSMIAGDFESVASTFDKNLAKQLDSEGLKTAWDGVTSSIGKHIGYYSDSAQQKNGYLVCTVVHEFEESGLKVTISYNDKGQIGGINLNYQAIDTDLASDENFEEIEFTFGDKLPLNGILTLPKSVDNPPVVLLVHGSGQSDKNETIMSNTPFKDIAYGLAKKGIATLRYDKRFFMYPDEAEKLGTNLTLREEVLDDVKFAIEKLDNDERFSDIYVLGHSLGGMLTPVIAYENQDISGIISMAGSLRPLYEISYDQNKDIEKSMSEANLDLSDLKKQMEQVEKDIITLRGDISNLPNEQILLGLPAGYQKSVKEYAGENYIDKIDLPILILQGVADFQVYADKDFKLWEDMLKNREDVTFKLYPDLNHLMMKTNGKRDITEYQVKGVVDEIVINDIAEFILK